jgi:hypothetical protein
VATLICAILAACTASSAPGAHRTTIASASRSPASSPRVFGPPGSAGNPLVLSCDAESWPAPPASFHPRPADLVIGPLIIFSAKLASTLTPAEYGYSSYGRGGRFYKMALAVTRGATATVTIAPPARGHVVITPAGGGVTSATYHSCAQPGGFFAQGFAFTDRPYRGCVPLEVTIGNHPPVHHLTLSLFAGPCTTGAAAGTTAGPAKRWANPGAGTPGALGPPRPSPARR